MKKIILTTLCLLALSLTSYGALLRVETITPFSTKEPPETVELKSLGGIQLSQNTKIENGDRLIGELTHIKNARHFKRDATFKYQINSVKPLKGESYELTEYNVGKYLYEIKIDAKKLATGTALKVTEQLAGGFGMGYRAIEGAVANRADGLSGIAKGAVGNVYDNSVLGYTKKGQEIAKEKGDKFYLVINTEKLNTKSEVVANEPEKHKKTHVKIDNPNTDFLNIFAEILSK